MPYQPNISPELFPDFSKRVLLKYVNEGIEQVPDIRAKIYDVSSTNEWYNQARSFFGPSLLSKTVPGGQHDVTTMSPAGNKTLTAAKWSLALKWTWEQVKFQKYDLVNPGRDLGRAEMLTKQVLAVQPLLNGFANDSGDPLYEGLDGHALFSTAHPLYGSGGTFSNRVSTSVTYSYAGVQEMFDIMAATPDANGFLTAHSLDMIVVPQAKQLMSREIFGSDGNPTTSTNATNVFNGLISLGDVIHWNVLDKYNTNAWFGFSRMRDLVFFEHSSPTPMTWFDPETDSYKHRRAVLLSFGHYDWRGAVGSPGV